MSAREILIAGGGIGGLAAALALAQKGRRVRVLEKRPSSAQSATAYRWGRMSPACQSAGVLKALEPSSFFRRLIFADALSNEEISPSRSASPSSRATSSATS
jgi:salicylate hydroxylase